MRLSFALVVLSITFVAALLAWYGVPLGLLRALVVVMFVMEAVSLLWFHLDMRWSPRGLFFLGWTLPFLVAQAPLDVVIFNLPKITHSGFLAFFVVSGLFYVAELLVRDTRPVRQLPTLDANIFSGTLDRAKFYAPKYFCISITIVALIAYVTALVHSGFVPPIFHEHVTDTAKEFWAIPGSATVFSLVRLFFVLAIVRWLSKRSHGMRGLDREDKLFIAFALVLSICMFTYGKRSIFIYSFLPVGVLLLSAFWVKARNLLLLFAAVIAFFVLNAYIRVENFEQYWVGKDFHRLPSAFWYSLIQPVIYVSETFANLSSILDVSMPYRSDLYGELHEMGKIVPLFGVLSAKVGNLLSLLFLFLVFVIYWISHRLATRGLWLLIYSLISPGLVMVWTGIIVDSQSMYRLVLFLVVWAFVALHIQTKNIRDLAYYADMKIVKR
jgi:hypothetical protein